jgi:hypothetical protein
MLLINVKGYPDYHKDICTIVSLLTILADKYTSHSIYSINH